MVENCERALAISDGRSLIDSVGTLGTALDGMLLGRAVNGANRVSTAGTRLLGSAAIAEDSGA